MTGAMIMQLLLAFGPSAFEMIEDLVKNWNTEMTPEQLTAFCQDKRKSREAWLEWARKELGK